MQALWIQSPVPESHYFLNSCIWVERVSAHIQLIDSGVCKLNLKEVTVTGSVYIVWLTVMFWTWCGELRILMEKGRALCKTLSTVRMQFLQMGSHSVWDFLLLCRNLVKIACGFKVLNVVVIKEYEERKLTCRKPLRSFKFVWVAHCLSPQGSLQMMGSRGRGGWALGLLLLSILETHQPRA